MDSCSPMLDVPFSFSCNVWYSPVTRSLSTLLFSITSPIQKLIGIGVFCVSIINVFVIVVHPAFRRKELTLFDDPSVTYSSGESVCPFLRPFTSRSLRISWSTTPISLRRSLLRLQRCPRLNVLTCLFLDANNFSCSRERAPLRSQNTLERISILIESRWARWNISLALGMRQARFRMWWQFQST